MSKKIDIIKYPFSLGSPLNRSHFSPEIVHKITQDIFSAHVQHWIDLPTFTKKPSTRRYKNLKNYAAVKEAVSILGEEIAKSLWKGHTPLTLGGDHTQGIATIKASVLILTAKAIIYNKISCKDKNLKQELTKAGNKEQIRKIETLISTAAKQKVIAQKNIQTFIDSIVIIWIDSHADYNTRTTSLSGNIHGMSLAACTGRDVGGIEKLFAGDILKLNPQNIFIFCARDIDKQERALLDKDCVNYKSWEMTKPGKIRSHTDPKNPRTLTNELQETLKSLKGKNIILSVDIDSIHAGLHKSPYGLESVAATGTPMGLTSTDIQNIFKNAAIKNEKQLIRLNAQEKSPAGPEAGDVFEALQGIINHKNIIAADLSEISPAAGMQGRPLAEKLRGLTLQTSIKTLSAMLGLDLHKVKTHLQKNENKLNTLIANAQKSEKLARATSR